MRKLQVLAALSMFAMCEGPDPVKRIRVGEDKLPDDLTKQYDPANAPRTTKDLRTTIKKRSKKYAR